MTPDSVDVEARRIISVLLVDDQSLLREGLRTLLELHPDLRIVGEAGDGVAAESLVERLRPEVVLMDLRMPRRDGVEATRRIVGRWPEVRVLVLTTFDDDELVFRSIEAGATGYLLKDVGSDALAEAVRTAGRGESPIQPSVAAKLLGRLRATSAGGEVGAEASHAASGRAPRPGADAGRGQFGSTAGCPRGEGVTRPADDAVPCPEPLTQRELDVLRLLGSGASNREIAERLGLSDGTVKNYVSALLGKTGLRDRTSLAVWAIRRGIGSWSGEAAQQRRIGQAGHHAVERARCAGLVAGAAASDVRETSAIPGPPGWIRTSCPLVRVWREWPGLSVGELAFDRRRPLYPGRPVV